MPDDIAATKAEALETELQASIDDAKAEVADDAATAEEKRLAEERLDRLERRLNDVEARGSAAPMVSPAPEPPPVVAAPVEVVTDLADKVAAIQEQITEPIADIVPEPIADLAEDAEEVIEELPQRTHSLFKKLPFGKRSD
jgi:chromatin segregation and condensation protein Rec8/ScpA/Scc1 (kleisin family)